MKFIKLLASLFLLFMIFFAGLGACFYHLASQKSQLDNTIIKQEEEIQLLKIKLSDEEQLRKYTEIEKETLTEENHRLETSNSRKDLTIRKGHKRVKHLEKLYAEQQDSTQVFKLAHTATQKKYYSLEQDYEVLVLNLDDKAQAFEGLLAKSLQLESTVTGLNDSLTTLVVALDQAKTFKDADRQASFAQSVSFSLIGVATLFSILLFGKVNWIKFNYKLV